MRTIEELSEEDVRDMLREGDDDYDNSLCINRDGEVLLIRDFFKNGPIGDGVILKVSELVHRHRRAIADNDADNDMVYLYTFHKGYGYVGQAAARDDEHVNKTFRDLKARSNEWKSIKVREQKNVNEGLLNRSTIMEENLEESLEEMEKSALDDWYDEALCNYSDDEAGEVFDGYDF